VKVSKVYPHLYNRWFRKVSGAIGRFLNQVNPEMAVLVDRMFCRIFLKSLLKNVLISSRTKGESIVVYAQDPLSARAALDLRDLGYNFRLVGVMHFNISESQEFSEKGIAEMNGKLCISIMENERYTLPKLDKIIFVSDFMQNVVCTRLPQLSEVDHVVISNFPFPIEEIDDSSVFPPSDLISIGTLEPRKNQTFLLKTLAECHAMGKQYTLTLIGNGPDRLTLEREAEMLGLSRYIHFLGYQPTAARFIAGCRVFVHCSKMESQGIVLLEALHSAVPIFAAPVGGIPEVFEDEKQGYYLDLDSPHGAALKLISVLEDTEKYQRMSAKAHETFITRFHPDVLGPRWINNLLGV
jgi:glycosyltransferase involved in cell wall biosynthesis